MQGKVWSSERSPRPIYSPRDAQRIAGQRKVPLSRLPIQASLTHSLNCHRAQAKTQCIADPGATLCTQSPELWTWTHCTTTPREPGVPCYDFWHWEKQQFLTSRRPPLKLQIFKLLVVTDMWIFDNIQLRPSSWKGLSFGGTFRMRSLNWGILHWVLVTLLKNTETREEDA